MRKLPFPNHLLNTPCVIRLNGEGLTEQGEPEPTFEWQGKVIFSEKARTITSSDNRLVQLEGQVIVKGDISPETKLISDGEVIVNDRVYKIHRSERARNPDGSVHHTVLELM